MEQTEEDNPQGFLKEFWENLCHLSFTLQASAGSRIFLNILREGCMTEQKTK